MNFWLWLYSLPGVGSKTIKTLVGKYGCEISRSKQERITRQEIGIDLNIKDRLFEKYTKQDIGVLPFWSADYPAKLKEIPDFPAFLFYKGCWDVQKFQICLSVVGTRSMTDYGRNAVQKLLYSIVKTDVAVVSGLAEGIDSEVHKMCVSENVRCYPVAVIPVMLDRSSFVGERRELYDALWAKGVVISEFPSGTAPKPQLFASRNRIIAGLSEAVLVVEAPVKSGALITADLALQYGREVGAVPGNIFNRTSEGTNELIFNGAYPVCKESDVYELLSITDRFEKHMDNTSFSIARIAEEFKISLDVAGICLQKAQNGRLDIEFLRNTVKSNMNEIRSVLTRLELEGIFKFDRTGIINLANNS